MSSVDNDNECKLSVSGFVTDAVHLQETEAMKKFVAVPEELY